MRQAFELFAGCRLEFIDDHTALFERMRRAPPDLVINFCDTGFGNVASQELHVPALLELLGVPYSGAAPACMVLATTSRSCACWPGADIPVPAEVFLGPDPSPAALPDRYPALIKPNQADGSIGIRQDAVVRSGAEAEAYIAWARARCPGARCWSRSICPGPNTASA